MTLEQRITLLAQAIGADIGDILDSIGDFSQLPTTANNSLVASLTELYNDVQSLANNGGAVIDDNAASSSTTATYSANKISTLISTAVGNLVDGAPDALNTLLELATELTTQDAALDNLLTAVGNRVRFDAAQSLTTPQKAQARANISAYGEDELGNPDTNFLNLYNTAKA